MTTPIPGTRITGIERDFELGEHAPAGEVLSGPAFYDDERVVRRYGALRDRVDGPYLALEQPVVLRFAGELAGRSILDLGCGDARFGKYALEQGAEAYVGLDGSRRMTEEAIRTLAGTLGSVRLADLDDWCGMGLDRFDLVVSRLVLQYVRDLSRLLAVVHHHLRPRGMFVFSIEHPVMTSTYRGDLHDGVPRSWQVSDYFRDGERADQWLGTVVRKYHRPLESYFRVVRDSGFTVDDLSEGAPAIENFAAAERCDQRRDVPMCVIFKCVRHE